MNYVPLVTKRKGKYGNNFWYVYSPKIKRNVHLFSDLEYEYWLLIELDPDVIDFCEQPLKIQGFFGMQEVSSIFDMWINRKDGTQTFVEIKYERDLHTDRVRKQISIQRDWCEQNNYNYQIKTDRDIRTNRILLENAKELIPYISHSNIPIDTDVQRITQLIGKSRFKMEELKNRLGIPYPRIKESVYRLIYEGKMLSNIDSVHLGLETEVWMHGKT